MITYIIGQAPNLPWYKIQNMSDVEIAEYNKGFLKVTEANSYCPRCDKIVDDWRTHEYSVGISYSNTQKGMHEIAKINGLKAWSLGCSCEECNKEFQLSIEYKGPMQLNDSVFEKKIWNAAIEAAYQILNKEHEFEPEHIPPRITGAMIKIRKLKK